MDIQSTAFFLGLGAGFIAGMVIGIKVMLGDKEPESRNIGGYQPQCSPLDLHKALNHQNILSTHTCDNTIQFGIKPTIANEH